MQYSSHASWAISLRIKLDLKHRHSLTCKSFINVQTVRVTMSYHVDLGNEGCKVMLVELSSLRKIPNLVTENYSNGQLWNEDDVCWKTTARTGLSDTCYQCV